MNKYNGLLKEGKLFYYHPQLTGDWETDKEYWEVIQSDIAILKQNINGKFTTAESERMINNLITILNNGTD